MILVTGGAGFIGSNLHAALVRRGHETAVVDHLGSSGKWRNLAKHPPEQLIPPEEIDAFLESRPPLEMIYHLGAITETTAIDGDAVWAANVEMSRHIWRWCANHGVRLVYASSAATYGDGSAGFDDDIAPAALARLRPLNLYGWSKHAFDLRVARAVAGHQPVPPQCAGLKFFNAYGPNEYHKGRMVSVVKVKHEEVAAGGAPRLFRSTAPGIADGAFARLESAIGELPVQVRHDPRQRRDVALLAKGGHLRENRNANLLAKARATDLGGGGALYDEPVRLRA